jgi:hypothetical protein
LSSVASPALQHISKFSLNGTVFGWGVGHKMCFFIFSTVFVGTISHSKKDGARYNQK